MFNIYLIRITLFFSIFCNVLLSALLYKLINKYNELEQSIEFLKKRSLKLTERLNLPEQTAQLNDVVANNDFNDYLFYGGIILLTAATIVICYAFFKTPGEIPGQQGQEIISTPALTDNITPENIPNPDSTNVCNLLDAINSTIINFNKTNISLVTEQNKFLVKQQKKVLQEQIHNNEIVDQAVCSTLKSVVETMKGLITAFNNITNQGEIAVLQKISEHPDTYEQVSTLVDVVKDSV